MINCTNTSHWLIETIRNRPLGNAIFTEGSLITYKELHKETLKAAGYLSSYGISNNEIVGILYRHDFRFYIIINALWILGAIPAPLNAKLTDAELTAQIHNAGINFLIVDEYNSNCLSQLDLPEKITFSMNSKNESPSPVIVPFKPDKSALIMHTSGSSGKPKAVVHTFNSIFESVKLFDSFASLISTDVLLASLPFYHVGGFMMLARALLAGGTAAFPESLQFEDLCESITNFNPSFISIVPTTLLRLTESGIKPNNKLRYALIGGGPASDDIILEGIKIGWPAVKVYGSTETCSMVTALNPKDLPAKVNSAGKPLLNVECLIYNEELLVKSPSLFVKYLNDEPETNKKLVNGFYHTGDFGRVEDGFLYIVSRREDIIISGGENVSAFEVESAIKQNELVEDACVFSMEDIKWGQIVCAAVKIKDNNSLSGEEIKEYLTGIIASYKIPKKFIIMDELPRNEMGKINRTALLEIIKNA